MISFFKLLIYSTINNLNNYVKFDIITDLHAYPNQIPPEINIIKNRVRDSDFIVYNGDIMNSVECSLFDKCNIEHQINRMISIIDKPFLFTLGNHDGDGKIRNSIINVMYNHEMHIGICNLRKKACRHPYLNIFTLDSNTYNCENLKSYGCPYEIDAGWVTNNIDRYNHTFMILFTHIPPPQVLGLNASGIVDERPCCWKSKNIKLLPLVKPKYHIFGHDHNNLYITEEYNGTRYVNALKTGNHRSYGPDFSNSGITRFIINNYTPYLNYSSTLDGTLLNLYKRKTIINYTYCGGNGINKNMFNKKNVLISIVIFSFIIIVTILLFCFKKLKSIKLNSNTKINRYERIN